MDENDLIDIANEDARLQEIEKEHEEIANKEDQEAEVEIRSQTIQDQEQKWGNA